MSVQAALATILLSLTFEGHTITAFQVGDRTAISARELGAALGYGDNGKRFALAVTSKWQMEEGRDFDIIEGDVLASVKSQPGGADGTPAVPSKQGPLFGGSELGALECTQSGPTIGNRARSLLVLYEPGVNIALLKTSKPAGAAVRRVIAEKVMPQLARTGEFSDKREVNKAGAVVDKATGAVVKPGDSVVDASPVDPKLAMQIAREKRLAEREARLTRQMAAEGIAQFVAVARSKDALTDEAEVALTREIAEIKSGRDLKSYAIEDQQAGWLTASAIGALIGVSANKVGRTAAALGLKDNPAMARQITGVAPVHHRPVPQWLYSPAAVEAIRQHLSA